MPDEEIINQTTQVESPSALEAISRAEIDIQVRTAKAYPRSIEKFKKDALALATNDAETARSCFYLVPRDGKDIEGASIRFAEIVGSAYGNLHYGGRIVSQDDHFIVAQGVAFDIEKNLRASVEVRRRITNKKGSKFSDDMIITTSNAAISIALRNAIFRIVPMALTKSILDEAKKVSLGKGLTMEQRRENAFRYFTERQGAKQEEILRLLKRRGSDDITIEDLIRLNGLRTAIEDGETTWQQVMEEAERAAAERHEAVASPADIIRESVRKAAEPKPDSAASGADASSISPAAGAATAGASETQSAERENVDEFQASIDPLTPEQRQALVKTIGSARLSPAKVKELCARFKVNEITQINFGQFKEMLELLATTKPAPASSPDKSEGKLFG